MNYRTSALLSKINALKDTLSSEQLTGLLDLLKLTVQSADVFGYENTKDLAVATFKKTEPVQQEGVAFTMGKIAAVSDFVGFKPVEGSEFLNAGDMMAELVNVTDDANKVTIASHACLGLLEGGAIAPANRLSCRMLESLSKEDYRSYQVTVDELVDTSPRTSYKKSLDKAMDLLG